MLLFLLFLLLQIGGGERRPPLGASLAPEVLRQHGGSMSRIGRRGKSTSSPVLDIRSHSAWDLGRYATVDRLGLASLIGWVRLGSKFVSMESFFKSSIINKD